MTQFDGNDPERLTLEQAVAHQRHNTDPFAPRVLEIDKQKSDRATINAMAELLRLKPGAPPPTEEVNMEPRFEALWEVRALSNAENKLVYEEATEVRENVRTHEQYKEVDGILLSRLVVWTCTVDPNLQDEDLARQWGFSPRQKAELIEAMLLPGEIDRLSQTIMRISGFREQLVDVAKSGSRKAE